MAAAAPAQAVQAGPCPPLPPSTLVAAAPADQSTGTAGGSRGLTLSLVLGGLLLFLALGVGLAIYCFSGGESGDKSGDSKPPPVVRKDSRPAPRPSPPPPPPPWLPAAEQRKVDQAIGRGVDYLKKSVAAGSVTAPGGGSPQGTGAWALAGLTLLNCDVPATDAAVQKVSARVRADAPQLVHTYDLAPCIWFLDRLNDPKDRALLRTLALRLIAGQDDQGGWPYTCPLLPAKLEAPLLALLRSKSPPQDTPLPLKNLPVLRVQLGEKITLGAPTQLTTNSLTLFAVVGLWVARKHQVPVDRSLALAEARFRASQRPDGSWTYQFGPSVYTFYDSMTCAGLLALAVGRGIKPGKLQALDQDEAIAKGFRYLGGSVGKAAVRRTPGAGKIIQADAFGDLYYFWAVERVAVVYDLRKIEGKPWYAWGASVLLPTQNPDGSWNDWFGGVVDTSFALLFLKRVNVVQDLTEKLKLAR